MRRLAFALLIAAPSVFSLPLLPSLPASPETGSVLLVLAGLLCVALIRRRQT